MDKGKFYILVGLILSCLLFGAKSQSLELEALPATTKWSQIKTDNFKVIFPNGFESEANRTANILEGLHTPASKSLGVKPRRFSVILQNQHAISNGFVTVGPRRSEFFTTSPQDNKSRANVDWIEHLATHEYRHMVQFEKAYHSPINKLMYWGFGEYGLAFAAGIAAPSWFWEGDAVGVETSFTKTGRGRTPSFELAFKTNLMEKGGFNYSKQNLTSFKDFVPNHYVTGYFMTTYFKRKYGIDIWDKIIKRAFGFPYRPFVFSNAIKKETGKNLLQNYKDMMSEMTELYSYQTQDLSEENTETINHRKNGVYTDYFYPHEIRNGNIISLKSGFSDTDKLVSIDKSGKEKVLFTTGILNDPGFLSINDNKVVWTEFEFDPRWLKRTYSVIKSFDLSTKTFRKITHKSKFTSAAISPDGTAIVAIENTSDNKYSVQLLDFESGEVVKIYSNANNAFYSMPSFSEDGNYIVLLKSEQQGKTIISKNISTGIEESWRFSENENFGHPIRTEDFLFYNSPLNGIDNIYALDISTKEVFQITHSKYGAFNPSLSSDKKKIIYNQFSKNGMDIVSMPVDASKWTPLQVVKDRNIHYADPMIRAENEQELPVNVQDKTYSAKPYRKLLHTVRPHSWGLSAIPTNNSVIVGVNSQDILSTTSISAGLKYDSDERNWLKYGNISYQGLYPIVDLSIIDGSRSTTLNVEGKNQTFNWKETTLSAGLRVPLVLTKSKYLRKLTFSSKSIFTSISGYNLPNKLFIDQSGNGNLNALEHNIQFVNVMRRSKLDLNSRFGQSFSIHYNHTPIGGNYQSKLFAIESNLFFPGIVKHHSIRLRGSYQNENSKNYYFDSPIQFTRGFGYFPFNRFTNLSFNYKLPVWYPDVHLGPLFNLQRVYVNGFYDHGVGTDSDQTDIALKSYGAELSFNFNIMRYLLLFDLGVRYAYMPEVNDTRIELIIGGITF